MVGQPTAPPSPGEPALGILKKVTAADHGLVEVPALTPHLTFHPLDDRQSLLVSETFNTLLHGRLHSDLLPLLDGRRPFRDIAAALGEVHSPSEVLGAISALAARGYVVLGRTRAGIRAGGVLDVARRLSEMGGGTARRVPGSSLGGRRAPRHAGSRAPGSRSAPTRPSDSPAPSPTLSVVVCTDYLDEGHAPVNRCHLSRPAGRGCWCGPAGCVPCSDPSSDRRRRDRAGSASRIALRGHQEVHNLLRNRGGNDETLRPRAAEPAVMDAVYGLAAATKSSPSGSFSGRRRRLHERTVSLDAASPRERAPSGPCAARSASPAATRRCTRADRPPAPVRLRPEPERRPHERRPAFGVGRKRTLARYRHLVSPVHRGRYVARAQPRTRPIPGCTSIGRGAISRSEPGS